jgi:dethiobiotin synthetase
MSSGFFITGTDTEVGKTLVSVAVIHALRNRGLQVAGMKPVASGCYESVSGLRNTDVDQIADATTVPADYAVISRYRFLPAIAPHIAAAEADVKIAIEQIADDFIQLATGSDCVVVEGVGGWQVPINSEEFMSDLAVRLQLPVIIVVGGRLGCINHALLTAESVQAAGLKVYGWVFNQVDPDMLQADAVKSALQDYMPGTMLADIEFQKNPDPERLSLNFRLEI